MSVFRRPEDAVVYLRCAAVAARRQGVAVHAYVLMSNHVHMLVTPAAESSLPKMMQAIGAAYVSYFNDAYVRTGTLWEGRYKAAIVDRDCYLLACMRYMELNPVRAGLVRSPAAYRWSSYHANALGVRDDIVEPHEIYLQLGATAARRRSAYRGLFAHPISADSLAEIRDATQHAWALGNPTFRHNVTALGRRAERLARGPRRAHEGSDPYSK
jgi:putative transposase